MEKLLQDVRYGLRQLVRRPGFAALAIISMALGIGANSSIFSLIETALLRPLAVHKPAQRFLMSLLWKSARLTRPRFQSWGAVLLLVALLACWIPARRAARVDPMVALRAQ